MSRICVKGLPKHVAEDRLREFFSQKGEVTDAKLMRTKDGKSRQFGFVGFRTEREAEEALKFFNNSFMDTCKITCEIARKVGDPEIPRPWSRYSSKQQEKVSEEKKVADPKLSRRMNTEGVKKGGENDDPKFMEFLQVAQPRSKSKLWENDTGAAPPTKNGKFNDKKVQVKAENKKKKASKTTKSDEINEEIDQLSDDEGAAKSGKHKEDVSDMDYFKSRVKKDWSDSESGDDDSDEDDSDDNEDKSNSNLNKIHDSPETQKGEGRIDTLDNDASEEVAEESGDQENESGEPSSSMEDDDKEALETGRLFVRNLPYTATEDDLEELFSKIGNVSQVHLVVDRETKRSKGIAFVHYPLPESAARALGELDNSIFQGRLLHVLPAKQKNPSERQEINGDANNSKSFKVKREEERKASEASGNTRAWNSLFMRSDTV